MTLDMLYVITKWWIAKIEAWCEPVHHGSDVDYRPAPSQLITFDAQLRLCLLVAPEEFMLCTDAGPSMWLAGAARGAGISDLAFPPKTVMIVKKDRILAAAGYRQPFKVLWTAREGILSAPRALPADL